MNESKLLSSEEDCLDGHHHASFLHGSSVVGHASSADLVPDDDTKFFLLATSGSAETPQPKHGTSSVADLPDPDAAVATALRNSDCLFGSTPPPDLVSQQLHEPDPNAYCCVPGTSFIFESVQDSTLCKAEPSMSVDNSSGMDSWTAAAVAAPPNQHLPRIIQSQGMHHHPQPYLSQQPLHMQYHQIYQHQQHLQQQQQQQHQDQDVNSVDQLQQAKFVLQLPNMSSTIGSVAVSNTSCVGQNSYGHHHHQMLDAPKRSRTNLTEEQKLELENTFVKSKYPDYPIVDELSRSIGLPYKKVLVWFKNRRAKEKRTHKADFDPCSVEHIHQHQQHLQQQRKSFGSGGSSSVVSDASTSGGSLSAFNAAVAAAAAAAVTQQQSPISQFPYAQYTVRKRLLPSTAQQQQQQQKQQQQLPELQESPLLHHNPIAIATTGATIHYQQQLPMAPATATYWIERSDLSSGLYHYHHYHPFPLLPAPPAPPPLPPPPPSRQSVPSRGHLGFAYPGENIATQTSPPMILLEEFNNDRVVGDVADDPCCGIDEDAEIVFGLDDGAQIPL